MNEAYRKCSSLESCPFCGTVLVSTSLKNISFHPHFARVCGLTKDDVMDALRLLFKNDEEKVQEHLAKLEKYTNGYHFSNWGTVPTIFNPDTVMWYLKVIFLKQLVLNLVLKF